MSRPGQASELTARAGRTWPLVLVLVAGVLVALGLVIGGLGEGDGPAASVAEAESVAQAPGRGPAVRFSATGKRAAPAGKARPAIRGLATTLHADDRAAQYEKTIAEVAALGANAVLMIVPYYQDYIESQEIYTKPWHPKAETFGRLVKLSRDLRMKVIVVPIVLIRYPRTSKDWRGVIEPPSWETWFKNYRARIVELAGWCEKAKVDVLAVGSELSSTEAMRDRWLETIRQVKAAYTGKLTYSSNWDRFRDITFWDRLDYVGMTAYWELNPQKDKQPTLAELMDAWRRIKPDVVAWFEKSPIPVIFTEVGYPSQDGCSYWPWNYYGSTEPDQEEQMLCYESFLRAWSLEPKVHGIFMYDWQDKGGPDDTGYTARGKLAEKVLRHWLKGKLQWAR